MKSIKFIFLFTIAFNLLNCNAQEKKQSEDKVETVKKQPNVLIIFPDQLRRYSAGFWSQAPYNNHVFGKPDPVITPNIDKLAKNGVVFTNAISNFPLCSPYRGMLLSGMYPEQNGIWNNCHKKRDDSLRDDVNTITDLFYQAGYNTSYFGKCHWLKNDPLFDKNGNYVGKLDEPGGNYLNNYDTYIPPGKSRHSIEYFYQAVKDAHFDPLVFSNDPNAIEGKKDGELHRPKIFTPKNEAQKIINYLQNQNSERDNSKPFCMIWSLNPPHNPWDDENTDMDIYREYYDIDKFPNIDNELVVRENADFDAAKHVRHYFANVTSTDRYIGMVLEELKRIGEYENTIIVFSSDHGELLGSHGLQGKNQVELESLAIPFIVHWPKGLEANISNVLISVPDVLPTVMGLAGLANQIPNNVEGINFSPLLNNPNDFDKLKPKASLIMLTHSRGVQTNQYTLCITDDKSYFKKTKTHKIKEAFVYDNINDPYQLNKIDIKDVPSVSKELLQDLAKLLKKTNDPWYQKRYFEDIIPY